MSEVGGDLAIGAAEGGVELLHLSRQQALEVRQQLLIKGGIVAEAAQAKLTAGDLKALQRTANDRTLVLNDALRRAPPTSPDLTF